HNVPFDLYWSVAGSAPQQCKVAVINSFGQTLFTKANGVSGVGQVVYSNVVDCLIPECDIAPINVALSTITTTGATVNWVAPATTSWDICVLPAGSPAPTLTTPDENTTLPPIFYNNIVANGTNPNFNFDISGLLADTPYDVYVRVNCSPDPSPWPAATTFTTLPTCPKPTGLSVPSATITTTSAQFVWANGSPTDTKWEILLVPSDTATLPTVLPPATPTFPGQITQIVEAPQGSPFQINGLDPAQIYFYYIRSICSDDNISTWAGPIYFNTVTCEPTTKCNYKFLLTNTSGNSWNGGRMQVLQNGILIQTLGASLVNNPTGVSIPLCPDVSIQLFWSVAGTIPENIGITIISPFNDIIYTKPAGTGTPLSMLFNQLGNCTPPTCPKPLSLAVDPLTIGTTTAKLTWTEQSTATQWEVFVTPFGSAPPVNYLPLHATSSAPFSADGGFYYLTDTALPFTVTGLTPGTIYQYYVRAICSSTDISTWTILNPIRFITKPINDECLGAIVVPVNPDRNCVQFAVGNTLGATRSLPNTAPVCPGNTDDDVWYTFQATSTAHIIKINNIVGTTTDLNHTLYSGNDCGALTQLYCSNPDTSIAVNLTPGNFYKIRVYTNGGNSNQTASFEVCITTPPPVTNDNCETATPAEVNNGLICTLTTPGSLTGATASNQGGVSCAGTEDDDIWFSFVSNSATQVIDLLNIQGTATDLNHAVYSGTCPNFTLMYCSDPDQSLNATFVPGQTYYIRVWSASNTLQDITFDLCIGRILPPITTSETQYTKQQLIEDIFLNTTCANVSNITFSTGTNFGSTNGIGYFNKDESEFPFDDGIILTTGSVLNAPGPNDSTLSDGTFDWPGDADLEAILPMASLNATKLEFDFTPLADQISFQFLFASEEYGTYQCFFSDAFAFILTDLTSGTSTNLAVLPDSSPVSVINIRDQIHNPGCSSVNPDLFAAFYGDTGLNPLGAPINYNGHTVPLTANSIVIPGNPYHIKLVIADRQDNAFDSAVFLKGDSFNIGNIELGNDLLESNGSAICPGDSVVINSGLDPAIYNFTWLKDGDEIEGETGPILTVTQPGVYTLQAQFGVSSCTGTDSITIEFFEDLTAGSAENLIDCNPTGTSTFDLTVNEASILAPFFAGTHTVDYFTTFEDADTNNLANVITTPTAFTNTSTPQIIYVRVNKTGTSCYQIVQFTLTVQDLTPQFTFSGDTSICPQETTTISVVPTDNNFDISLVTYQWQYLGVDIAAETNNSITIGGTNYGMYSCTVNNTGCVATQNVEITNSNTVWDLTIDAPATLCPDENGTITSTVTNNPTGLPEVYTYTLPDLSISPVTTNVLPIDAPGDYTIKVSILGCESTQTITVISNTSAFDLDVKSGCDGNNYKINANPVNNSFDPETSTFSWKNPSGNVISLESFCIATIPGTYTCTITNADGCFTTENIVVSEVSCSIQKGISPKGVGPGDGLNDS
ncbi:MAG: choice-of-anchor L domain-containing protein, partial [Cyclobacteriaceae bacterium]|nr:choice-of-anchor L domain-containing protein [Cyclobacteriaceae bacterium]